MPKSRIRASAVCEAEGHLLLGRIYLRNGRIREAINAFKIAVWSSETAEAHAALGEAFRQAKALPLARAEAERALAMDPTSSEAQRLLDMLKSPQAWLHIHTTTPSTKSN